MQGVALLGDRIRLGERTYKLFHEPNPRPGFDEYYVELNGLLGGGAVGDFFDLDAMRGVIPTELPDNFGMSIYSPNLSCKEIDGVSVTKRGAKCSMHISVRHYFSDWLFPVNLYTFYKNIKKAFVDSTDGVFDVSIDKDEYGISASIEIVIDPTIDLFTHCHMLSRRVKKILEESIVALSHPGVSLRPSHSAPELKPDELGFKWWLRYVVVPLIGIVVAAIVTIMLKHAAG